MSLRRKLRIHEIIRFLSRIDAKWFKLIRGFAIFIIAILLLTYTALYIVENKIEVHFMLKGFEGIPFETPTFDTVLSSMAIRTCLTLLIVFMVTSLMAFLREFEWKLTALLILLLHSFIVMIIFTSLQIPFMMSVPKVSFAIVDVGMQNVTFYNASMSGITSEGLMTITSNVIKAGYVKVFRMYPNMTIPDWHLLGGESLNEALENTITYMNMSDVRLVYGDSEISLESFGLSRGNWSRLEYEMLLNRYSIRLTPIMSFEEYMLSIFSMLSTIGIIVYNTIGFRRLYEASIRYTIITGIVMFIVLFFLIGL